jgi:hypothetical protein
MENRGTLEILEVELSIIEKKVNELITFSLKIIESDSSLEKEILQMFMDTSTRISNHFIKETENTNTEHVGKSVIKYAMFNKF